MSCEYCRKVSWDLIREEHSGDYDLHVDIAAGFLRLWSSDPSTSWMEQTKIDFCPKCSSPLSDPTPLTLKQLRGMDGEPVWIESEAWKIAGEWGIVRNVKLTGHQKLYVHFHSHGKNGPAMNVSEQDYGTWLAYTHKPKDREGEG